MSIKPILFNTDMVRAILDGKKTQTRRVIKPQPTNPRWNNIGWPGCDDCVRHPIQPPYEIGDVLWVRETWDNIPVSPGGHMRFGGMYYYKADGDIRPVGWRGNWHPSIHMPKEAARVFLRVKDVRVERLQDIKNYECVDEGAVKKPNITKRGDLVLHNRYKEEFARLWDTAIKPADCERYGWNANPWVWVIEFERCGKPERW